jgi:hypothetical protein
MLVPPFSLSVAMCRYGSNKMGRDSSVCIGTRFGLGGPGIDSRWEEIFSAPVQTGRGVHPASYTMGTGSFPGVTRPRRGVDHPPSSSAKVKEGVSYTTTAPLGLRGLL